jgi:UDP-N-acetyl-D-galactosamine dehydrogenase
VFNSLDIRSCFNPISNIQEPNVVCAMPRDAPIFAPPLDQVRIGVIGLGYVGLPLAVEFSKSFPAVGYDIDRRRIEQLVDGHDRTREVDRAALRSTALRLTAVADDLSSCNVYVVTVPTPVDAHKRPDLSFLVQASEMIGTMIKVGDLVIYESTVYPGATEEVCAPAIERSSGLAFNRDFFLGYSPERANPGDREHRLMTIRKVTAGSTPEAADYVDSLFARVIPAGTYRVSSIRVAEAAKVIENTQRDLNIALVNEFALIFNRLGIDTQEVLDAAATKWNFLPFWPGLVGGHCIGVDPYYLTHKAEAVGYHPQVILSGRRINDGMGAYVAGQLVKSMLKKGVQVAGSRILIMGMAFKEDCPDIRNTRVVDIITELREYNAAIDVWDPCVNDDDAEREYGIRLIDAPETGCYDAIILALAHRRFREMGPSMIGCFGIPSHVFYDIKSVFPKSAADLRL